MVNNCSGQNVPVKDIKHVLSTYFIWAYLLLSKMDSTSNKRSLKARRRLSKLQRHLNSILSKYSPLV